MLITIVLGCLLAAAGVGICYCCFKFTEVERTKDLEIAYLKKEVKDSRSNVEHLTARCSTLKKEAETVANQLVDAAIIRHDIEHSLKSYKALHKNQAKSIEELQAIQTENKDMIRSLRGQVSRLKLDVSDLLNPEQTRLSLPELIKRCREDIKAI